MTKIKGNTVNVTISAFIAKITRTVCGVRTTDAEIRKRNHYLGDPSIANMKSHLPCTDVNMSAA